MIQVHATLVELQAQKVKSTTLAKSVSEYVTMIKEQYSLNLPTHTFWTTTSVVDPIAVTSLEYKDLKLDPQAK